MSQESSYTPRTDGMRGAGFTLVELIIVIVILIVLGSLGLMSFSGYNSTSRDATRIEDLSNIQKSLGITAVNSGKYPIPDGGVSIYNSGSLIRIQ